MQTIKPEMFRDAPIKFVVLVLEITYGVFAVATGTGDVGPGVLLICGSLLLVWWLRTITTNLTLDQNDLLFSSGILSKTRVKLDRRKIRSVEVRQTLMHRLTDVGSLAVYTAGDVPEVVLWGVRQPNSLRDHLARRTTSSTIPTPADLGPTGVEVVRENVVGKAEWCNGTTQMLKARTDK